MPRIHLAWLFLVPFQLASAQEVPFGEELRARVAKTGDLVQLVWSRDPQGNLLTACPELGVETPEPMFSPDAPTRMFEASGVFGYMCLFHHGDSDLLGMTAAERHLRHIGVGTAEADLLRLAHAPITAAEPERARVELFDRLLAVDRLRQLGAKTAVPGLEALAAGADVPPPLRARAARAAAVLAGKAPPARRRLDPESLPLPLVADAFLVVDHARLPDPSGLAEFARKTGIASSLAVLTMLKAPRPEDVLIGQRESDSIAELPFEMARQFGNVRMDHTLVVMQMQVVDGQPQPLFQGHCAGEFETDRHGTALQKLAEGGFPVETKDGTVRFGDDEFGGQVTRELATLGPKKLAGKPRPDVARELLRDRPEAIRIVIPPASKVWLALAFAELPPAERSEIAISFGAEFRLEVTITARDEDAADAWVERGKALLAQAIELAKPAVAKEPELQRGLDALAGVKIAADGRTVRAVLATSALDLKLFEAMQRVH